MRGENSSRIRRLLQQLERNGLMGRPTVPTGPPPCTVPEPLPLSCLCVLCFMNLSLDLRLQRREPSWQMVFVKPLLTKILSAIFELARNIWIGYWASHFPHKLLLTYLWVSSRGAGIICQWCNLKPRFFLETIFIKVLKWGLEQKRVKR